MPGQLAGDASPAPGCRSRACCQLRSHATHARALASTPGAPWALCAHAQERAGAPDAPPAVDAFAWGSIVVGGPLDPSAETERRLAVGAGIACRLRGALLSDMGARVLALFGVRGRGWAGGGAALSWRWRQPCDGGEGGVRAGFSPALAAYCLRTGRRMAW